MKLFELKGPDSPSSSKVKRIATVLMNECRPFLEEIDFKVADYPMYRGLTTKVPLSRKFKTNKVWLANRKPLNTPQYLHDLVNEIFEEDLI